MLKYIRESNIYNEKNKKTSHHTYYTTKINKSKWIFVSFFFFALGPGAVLLGAGKKSKSAYFVLPRLIYRKKVSESDLYIEKKSPGPHK